MAVFLFIMEKVIAQSLIKASPEKIWRALTNADEMRNWYFDIPDFRLKLHHSFNFYEPGGENKYHHQCEILEIIPNAKFQHTWAFPKFSPKKSLVTWELHPTENGTNVILTHAGLENFADLGDELSVENFKEGWEEIVKQSLKNYVEKSN